MAFRVGIRWWLLGANAFILVFPVGAFFTLRLYDNYLVRQTERQLIAQAVVVAEVWRAYRDAEVVDADHTLNRLDAIDIRPPGQSNKRFVPIEPVLNLTYADVSPAADEEDLPQRQAPKGKLAETVRHIESLLRRAQVFNLSAVRILDAQGCVLATTRGYRNRCLTHEEEVARALRGRYWAVARRRLSDEPRPWLSDIRRRGDTRIFIALPVFSDSKVIAVVHMSRTSLDAVTSLWGNRRGLVLLFLATLVLTALTSFMFAGAVARPLRLLTRTARTIAAGNAKASIPEIGIGPKEVHSLRAALDQMTTELTHRADYIAEFAANISHELKTPLTGIRGATELLRDEWGGMTSAQRERFIHNIADDAERMERLVGGLLSLARIRVVADARECVQLSSFFSELQDRYPEVDFDLSGVGTHAELIINPDHLASAVGNLLDNALAHGGRASSYDGGLNGAHAQGTDTIGTARPQLHAETKDGALYVQVRDFGIGVSPSNEKRLFDRFFTTARDQGGTGLGLSVVRAIAESRSGSVSYERPAHGGGALFNLTL